MSCNERGEETEKISNTPFKQLLTCSCHKYRWPTCEVQNDGFMTMLWSIGCIREILVDLIWDTTLEDLHIGKPI
jgi:hypothetical protein